MGLLAEGRARVKGLVLVGAPRSDVRSARLGQGPHRRVDFGRGAAAGFGDIAAGTDGGRRACLILENITSSESKGVLRSFLYLGPLLRQVLRSRGGLERVQLHLLEIILVGLL